MTTDVQVLGVYDVPQNTDVSLVEVLVQAKPSEVEVGEFTQEEPDTPRDSWQAAYMERYLNETGDTVIGDDMDLPGDDKSPTRLTFFMYYLDTTRPMLTPFGEVNLSQRIAVPDRLKDIIPFDEVD
jgi:hypothetical protein